MRCKIRALISFFAFAVLSANSQNNIDFLQKTSILDSVQIINEVVVTAKWIQKEIIPVQVLSGTQLEKLNAHSVADALRYFSGIQIKDYGGVGGLKTVNIRGLGTNHVGVFYDGVQLGNAQNGVVDLGRFSLGNMESISMYNGQKSDIFQPAKDFASANSIYMRSRKPIFEEGKRNNFNLSLAGGSFATINPSALWEHRINDKLSSSMSAEYMHTSGEYKFRYAKEGGYDTTEMRKNGDVRLVRVEAALFGALEEGEWRGKIYFYDSQRGYPGAVVRSEPGKFPNQDRQWDTNLFAQSSLRKKISPIYSLLLNGKYAYDYLHYISDPRIDISTMYVNNIYKQQELYFSAANMFSIFDWWSSSLSTDFQWNTLDADIKEFVYPQRYTTLTSAATSINLRGFKLQASLLHTYVSDKTIVDGAAASDKSVFTPTVVASYKPLDDVGLNFRAFYKRIFRMPTFNDLYYTFIGNREGELDPEYASQYNIGATYSKSFTNSVLGRFEAQIDGYFNQVENKIVAKPTSNQFLWTMENLGYVEIRGVDVAIQGDWSIGEVELTTRANYTYQKAQDFTDTKEQPKNKYYGGQIPYIPWHSGSAIVGGSYHGWGMNYSYIYTGERYESEANIAENYVQPWYTHDISLSKTMEFKSVVLRLTAEINNIFNQQYEVVQWYPMPGTNFKIKINIIL